VARSDFVGREEKRAPRRRSRGARGRRRGGARRRQLGWSSGAATGWCSAAETEVVGGGIRRARGWRDPGRARGVGNRGDRARGELVAAGSEAARLGASSWRRGLGRARGRRRGGARRQRGRTRHVLRLRDHRAQDGGGARRRRAVEKVLGGGAVEEVLGGGVVEMSSMRALSRRSGGVVDDG
jgi:hypothetical protein